jgi:uncharacterized protein (TIGR03437 family)
MWDIYKMGELTIFFVRLGFVARIAFLSIILPSLHGQIVRTDVQPNDVYYSKTTGLVYVTTSSTSAHYPNSLLAINPVTGQDAWHTNYGSANPVEVAGSDDGSYAYVYLQAAGSIIRINLLTQQQDMQFPATTTLAQSGAVVAYMKVMQGDPNTLAVSFVYSGTGSPIGIALFTGGTQLPNTIPGSTGCLSMAYGAAPTTMWCHDAHDSSFTLYQLGIDSNGIHTVGTGLPALAYGFNQTPQFYNSRLYFNSLGLVIDPVLDIQVALLPWVGTPTGDFVVDPDAGLVYFSRSNDVERYFWVIDANRFIAVAYSEPDISQPEQWIESRMVRCGAGGLAGINENGQLVFIPLKAIPPLAPVVPPAPTVDSQGIVRLAFPNQSVSYSPALGKLYVSVPDGVTGLGNGILALDPASLTPSTSLWVGSRPSTIAVTQDGLHAYVELDGSSILRRVNLQAFAADFDTLLFDDGTPLGINTAGVSSIVPLPGNPDSVAVSFGPVAIYDYGVRRPNVVETGGFASAALDETGTVLHVARTSFGIFENLGIGPAGVALLPGSLSLKDTTSLLEINCASDICAFNDGLVVDGSKYQALGTCPIGNALPFGTGAMTVTPLVDAPDRRAYFLMTVTNEVIIVGCSLDTFYITEQIVLLDFPQFGGSLMLVNENFVFNTGSEILSVPKSTLAGVQPPPVISSVLNSASYSGGGFAPVSIVSIFGTNLASATATATSTSLYVLGGVSASLSGFPCVPLYVSPNQINLVLPYRIPNQYSLQVTNSADGATSSPFPLAMLATAPGIFTTNGNAIAQNQDYTTNTPSNPATAQSVVIVYFTGQGAITSQLDAGQPASSNPTQNATAAPTAATIDGQPAAVLYSGAAPGFSGLAQANIQLPNLAAGEHQLILTVGGAASNPASISVK